MANTIQVRRGANASLPTLNAGEFGFSTDTYQIYIGDGSNNHELLTEVDLDNTPVKISCHNATGSAIAIRSVCYISGDQSGVPQITKAQADTAANAKKMLVITTAEIANGAAGVCTILGILPGFSGLTAGAIQYLSDDTAGAIEETATTTTGEIVRIIGYAISTTEIIFNPDKTYVEV